MPSFRTLLALLLLAGFAVLDGGIGSALGLAAQEIEGLPQPSSLATQSLRPYWHVFGAYAIAILLIGGWAVSIARRLRAVEERLQPRSE